VIVVDRGRNSNHKEITLREIFGVRGDLEGRRADPLLESLRGDIDPFFEKLYFVRIDIEADRSRKLSSKCESQGEPNVAKADDTDTDRHTYILRKGD